jgi:hypothetical protein
MKRFALCLACAIILLSGLAGAEKAKGPMLSLDFFEGLTYTATQEDYKAKIEELGGKVRRDGIVLDASLDTVAIRRVWADFLSPGREGSQLIGLTLEIEPRRSATYMQPGANYDALLNMLCDRYGNDYQERATELSHTKTWIHGHMTIGLR